MLDGVDTECACLLEMRYNALEEKIFKYVHNMLDIINQSEEDSEKALLKVRQGELAAPMTTSLQEYSDVWCSIKKNNPGAIESFDPKGAIIDERSKQKIKDLQAKAKDFEAKERRRMGKLASRRRLKATKRLVQEEKVGDTQPKKQRDRALQEAGAQ